MSDLPNYLPGTPPMYGLRQPPSEFPQGSDVYIEFELNYNDQPLTDPTNWTFTVFVKKSLKAQTIIWQTVLGEKLKQKTENIYYFWIPASENADTVPGTYYYSVQGVQAQGTGVPYDATVVLTEGVFNVTLSTSSPKPRNTSFSQDSELTEPNEGDVRTLITYV